MNCTRCNRLVLPVVAFDIDGTLADYHEDFILFAARYYDRPMRPGYDGSTDLAQWMELSKEDYRACKLAYRQGGGKRLMPPAERAVGTHVQAVTKFAEVWLTTTRPYMRFDSTDPDTREWLRRHQIPFAGLIYEEDKYKALADIVGAERVIGVVEDLPDQYDRAEQLGLNPILVERRHNISRPVVDGRYITPSIRMVVPMLKHRAREWNHHA